MIKQWFKHTEKRPTASTFHHILDFANQLANTNPAALFDLVRLLLRPLQSELLISAVENELHGARHEIETFKFFMPYGPAQIQLALDCPKLNPDDFLIQLNRDPVLPCPWHRDRYAGTLSNIGTRKKCGQWKQDNLNHYTSIWLPWGVVFVGGGNHSIAAGILGGEGNLTPTEVLDMGKLLDQVSCDGKHFRSSITNEVLDEAATRSSTRVG